MAAKKARIIDIGTRYDVVRTLRQAIRNAEKESFGRATDVVVAVRSIKKNGEIAIMTAAAGTSQNEVWHFMSSRLVRRFIEEDK